MGKVETEASARDDLAAVYRMCDKLGLNEGAIWACKDGLIGKMEIGDRKMISVVILFDK